MKIVIGIIVRSCYFHVPSCFQYIHLLRPLPPPWHRRMNNREEKKPNYVYTMNTRVCVCIALLNFVSLCVWLLCAWNVSKIDPKFFVLNCVKHSDDVMYSSDELKKLWAISATPNISSFQIWYTHCTEKTRVRVYKCIAYRPPNCMHSLISLILNAKSPPSVIGTHTHNNVIM